jgi:antitoxin component YwqK of YwqJK toxin-antitoxin module
MKQQLLLLFLILFTGLNAQEKKAFRLLYPNGLVQEEGTRNQTHKEGVSYVYSADKQLVKKVEYVFTYPQLGHFENYRLTEKITYYAPNGDIISIQDFENGKNVTKNEDTYPNGQLMFETTLDADKIHETTINYFENGKIKSRMHFYQSGKKRIFDGPYETFFSSGKPEAISDYKNGLKEGELIIYNEKGILLNETIYENDTAVSSKQYNSLGKQLYFWSKYSPEESTFSKEYYPNDSVLKNYTYRKRITIDTTSLVYVYSESYDQNGIRTNIYVRTKTEFQLLYGVESVVGKNHLANGTFSLERYTTNGKEPYLQLSAGYKVEQQGFYIDNMLKFPLDADLKEQTAIIKDGIEKVRKYVKEKRVNEKHMVNDSMFGPAFDYYKRFPEQLFYSEALIQSNLDSTLTGDYRIDYKGTNIYFVGSLKNGFQHGKAQLFLNEKQLLFERNYVMGFEHGLSKDWFIDGALCDEISYEYGVIKNSKFYHSNGKLWTETRFSSKRQEIFKQRWSREGKILEYLEINDTINRSFLFNLDGKLNNYRWVNKKDSISIGRTLYKDRKFATIQIPHDANNPIAFNIKFGGVEFEGLAKWDENEKKSILTDNYGEIVQFDRSVITYPKELPCKCEGWEKYDFFAQATTDFVDEKKFLKYQFDFHAPITDLSTIFGNPYYLNQEPEEYKLGRNYHTYSFHFSPKPLTISLPDTNGIQLVIEPCKSRFAFVKFEVSTHFKVGSLKETTATIHKPKQIALQFPRSIMTQLDVQFNPLKDDQGLPYKGMFLFEAKEIKYDYYKEINATYTRFMYGRPMLLGTSGLILDTREIVPDFSTTENYPAMNAYWNKADKKLDSVLSFFKLNWGQIEKFRGASITEGLIYLPAIQSSERIKCDVQQLIVSATYCLGAVSFPAKPSNKSGVYLIESSKGTTDQLNISELTEWLNKSGIKITPPTYNKVNARIQFYIYFKPQ